jgi:hypothetical protein
MVRGIEIFRERFRDCQKSLVLIGGAACDEWFSRLGLSFRATRDLDIVLILEAVSEEFVAERMVGLTPPRALLWVGIRCPVGTRGGEGARGMMAR